MKHVRIALIATLVAASLVIPAGAYAESSTDTDPAAALATTTAAAVGTPTEVAPNPAPVLIVRSYSSSAERILVGAAFNLTLDVYNATARRADNVVVSLGEASSGTAAAAAATAGGLTVLGTGNAKFLGALKGQRNATVGFQVMAGPGTTPGTVTLPVTVSFEHAGVRQQVSYTIGLVVERDAALSLVTAELPESALEGEPFEASFEVANASAFALSGVTLSIEASGADVTDGTLFLGTFDAATTEVMDVTVTPGTAGELELAVVITYRDDFGRTQTFRETRTVTVEAAAKPDPGSEDDANTEDGGDNWFVKFIKSLFGLG